jgi:hypothetical protein
MRTWPLLVALFVCALPSVAQRSQLARKGRLLERSPVDESPGIRRLPRARDINPLRPNHESIQDYVERMRAADKPQYMPLARLRDLMQDTADRPSPDPGILNEPQPARPVLRLSASVTPLESYVPSFAVPAEAATLAASAEVASRWNTASEFPEARRYSDPTIDVVNQRGRKLDPYNRHKLKGDFAIFGRKVFLSITGTSDTLTEYRRLPAATPPSADQSGSYGFFSAGESLSVAQHFRVGVSLFQGSAGFKPVNWEVKITPEFDINYLLARENTVTDIDTRQGISRTDTAAGIQELYFEKRLTPDHGSPNFDFASLRLGVQRFTSDFRGFVFSDEQPGARLFGTFQDNRWQYSLAMFHMLEKNSNSGLNTFQNRHQTVYAANLYRFDAMLPGYNVNFSALYNNDQPSFLIDDNGFLIRPVPLGTPLPHKVRAGYAGISGDGHIGRVNISHAFYQAFGRDDFNPIAGRPVHINAQLAAWELSYERDWKKFKASIFYTSGQRRINDSQARGFDGIVPNQQFAGGGFLNNPDLADRGLLNSAFTGGGINFLNREAIPLTGTSVFLFGPNSLMPTLRPGLFQGQANFVNPGIWVYNLGFDAKWTPKWKASLNVNYLQFDRTEVLEALLFQSGIRRAIGFDTGLGLQYRPKLNDNIVLTGGFGVLMPRAGFENLFTTQVLYSGFILARFQF